MHLDRELSDYFLDNAYIPQCIDISITWRNLPETNNPNDIYGYTSYNRPKWMIISDTLKNGNVWYGLFLISTNNKVYFIVASRNPELLKQQALVKEGSKDYECKENFFSSMNIAYKKAKIKDLKLLNNNTCLDNKII